MRKVIPIEIPNTECSESKELVASYMDFESLWKEYEQTKDAKPSLLMGILDAVDSRVIKRSLFSLSIIILVVIVLLLIT
jgi:hypothetical protein